MNKPSQRPNYHEESEKWENPFWVMLVRMWEDCEKHVIDMLQAKVNTQVSRNIIINVLTKSQTLFTLTTSQIESLSLPAAESSIKISDAEENSKSNESELRSYHLSWIKLMWISGEEPAEHVRQSLYWNISNVLIIIFLWCSLRTLGASKKIRRCTQNSLFQKDSSEVSDM